MRIIHTSSSADVIKRVIEAGYRLDRIRGSHHVFTKPGCRPIVIPHPKKQLGKGLVAAILRQAGL